MGLHGSLLLGPRMGSVTYRMICLSPTLVLALPPTSTEPVHVQVDVPALVSTEATA